jgi:3-oxoacyl-[acyl-carrier-protein] synthase-1/3-oxoacyl-[acyl-carrier-protein] synthase II
MSRDSAARVDIVARAIVAADVAAYGDLAAALGDNGPAPRAVERFAVAGYSCTKAFHAVEPAWDSARADAAVRELLEDSRRRYGIAFARDAEPVNRTTALLLACCDQLAAELGTDIGALVPAHRAGIFLGTCSGYMPEAAYAVGPAARDLRDRSIRLLQATPTFSARIVQRYLGWPIDARVSVQVTNTACSSSLDVIGRGVAALASGRLDLVIAGGMDVLNEAMHRGFDATKVLTNGPCRPFDRDRRGFQLGEGAGLVVLMRPGALPSRGTVESFGAGLDGFDLTAPDPAGRGLRRAVGNAFAKARGPVGGVIAHGTATWRNDAAEADVYSDHLPAGTPVTSLKSRFGHSLGAAGIHNCIAALHAIERGTLPGTANLQQPLDAAVALSPAPAALRTPRVAVSAAAFGGHNATVVVSSGGRP